MTTRPYRPSNSSEGESFCNYYCYRCQHDTNETCEILTHTLIYDIGDPEYPKEWVQDDAPFPNNNPRCTAFLAIGDDAELAAARNDPRQKALF